MMLIRYILTLLILLGTVPQVLAQSYQDYHNYIYSKKVTIKPNESIAQVLAGHGYDLNDQKNWVKVTQFMNGLKSSVLKTRSKKMEIYLPPTQSYQDYVNKSPSRTIASEKPFCRPVSKEDFVKHYGREAVSYLEYFELITSRKVNPSGGETVDSLVMNDQFAYADPDKTKSAVKRANGLRNDILMKNQVIYLPFCSNEEGPSREIASVESVIEIHKQDDQYEQGKLKFSASTSYGQLAITRADEELKMNLMKFSGRINYTFESGYTLTTNISSTQFSNILHSNSDEAVSSNSLYPEYGLSASKVFGRFRLGLGYDIMNYFVMGGSATTINLIPVQVHRVTFSSFLPLTGKFGIFGNFGYLPGVDEYEVTGGDISVGGTYSFGPQNKMGVSLAFYTNQLSTNASDEKESSQVVIGSFSYNF